MEHKMFVKTLKSSFPHDSEVTLLYWLLWPTVCRPPGWDRVNWSARNWGCSRTPSFIYCFFNYILWKFRCLSALLWPEKVHSLELFCQNYLILPECKQKSGQKSRLSLKVSLFRNVFLVSSILPKNELAEIWGNKNKFVLANRQRNS